MPKPPPSPKALMLDLARKHVAQNGYPRSDFAVIALVNAMQPAVPVGRPVEVLQPGKSQKAREARLAALEREAEPTVPAAGSCHLACPEVPVGWRLYVQQGWLPVCSRHMGGAKAIGRRLNRDLGVTEAGR